MTVLLGLVAAVPLAGGAAIFLLTGGPHLGSMTGWAIVGGFLAYMAALNWWVDHRG